MSHWYLIHTKINQEQIAQANLEIQGYRCYLPYIRAEKVRTGRLQPVQEPLFPRYLFIQHGFGLEPPSLASIRSTLGVSRLVTFGQAPGKLSADLMALIQSRSKIYEVPVHQFAQGDVASITECPIAAGMEAIYQMTQGEERVMALLHILSKQIKKTLLPMPIRKLR